MVGSGGGDRSKEAVGMMALHEALRTLCLTSDDWTYSVFWTLRPRPRIRGGGGNGCKVGDDTGSLMLMWEDGFCRGRSAEGGGEDLVRKAFGKMSIQLYNYGEGLMGKVAADKCHKWVFKEPTQSEPNISNYWQSSFDALPSEWNEQFDSGIQTIAVIQAGHGLLQLGSCKIIAEDLHFVLRMRQTFESLGHQSGFYLSQLFSSTRSSSPVTPIRAPPPLFDWGLRPVQSGPSVLVSPKDEPHTFLLPQTEDHESDIKWPNGLSFFSALTGRADEAKLLFSPDEAGPSGLHSESNPDEFLSLDERSKAEGKFKRSFTLPARMSTSSSSNPFAHHGPGEYRNKCSNAM